MGLYSRYHRNDLFFLVELGALVTHLFSVALRFTSNL
jgi:hypothetical protein